MNLNFNFYTALVLISAITSFLLSGIAWRNRKHHLANKIFALLMFSIGWWAFANFLELLTPDFSTKRFFSNFVYLGTVSTVALWFLFSLAFTERDYLINIGTVLLLTIEPILLLLLVWTNPYHHLIHTAIWLDETGAFPVLMAEYGWGFWFHSIYSYILLFIGTIMLLQYMFIMPNLYRKQVVVLTFSLAIPWILNALYLLGITKFGLTAAGFTVGGFAIAWGLLRLHFLDVIPTARTAVFASLYDAVLTLDEQNRVVDLNPAAEKLIGLTQAEVIGMPVENVFSYQPQLVETYADKQEAHVELAFTHIEPPEYYDLRISPIYNRQQQLVAKVISIRDITAQKVAEKAVREKHQLAEALRDVAVALNSTLDPKELFSRILENVNRVLPHDSANIMLNDGGVTHIVDLRVHIDKKIDQAIYHRRFIVDEITTLRHMTETQEGIVLTDVRNDPTWHFYPDFEWIRSYIGVPILQDREVIGFINLDSSTPDAFQEIYIDRLQAFADQVAVALKNAWLYKALEERNQELDAYAYTVAHDLNSPLSLVKGYIDLLFIQDLPETAREYLQQIADTTDQMTEMVDQLLLLTRLRDVETTAVPMELYPLILAVKARFENQIQQKNICLDIQQEWSSVLGQPIWVEEVFANLIGNAIKYIGSQNESPHIQIHGKKLIEKNQIYIAVTDNGLGINLEYTASLFEMFTRFHKEEASGTGLGLTIVQRIVNKLGGEVGLTSMEGQGSTFWFTLPAA